MPQEALGVMWVSESVSQSVSLLEDAVENFFSKDKVLNSALCSYFLDALASLELGFSFLNSVTFF